MTTRHFQRSTQWGLDTDRDLHWSQRGECRTDPERMWPLPNDLIEIANARRVCERCPLDVRHACIQDGIDTADWDSVRGGFTGRERLDRHREGFAIPDYPPAEPAVRSCQRCSGAFPFDLRHPYARVCPGCDKRRAERALVVGRG